MSVSLLPVLELAVMTPMPVLVRTKGCGGGGTIFSTTLPLTTWLVVTGAANSTYFAMAAGEPINPLEGQPLQQSALGWFLNPDRKSTRLNSSHHSISYAV